MLFGKAFLRRSSVHLSPLCLQMKDSLYRSVKNNYLSNYYCNVPIEVFLSFKLADEMLYSFASERSFFKTRKVGSYYVEVPFTFAEKYISALWFERNFHKGGKEPPNLLALTQSQFMTVAQDTDGGTVIHLELIKNLLKVIESVLPEDEHFKTIGMHVDAMEESPKTSPTFPHLLDDMDRRKLTPLEGMSLLYGKKSGVAEEDQTFASLDNVDWDDVELLPIPLYPPAVEGDDK